MLGESTKRAITGSGDWREVSTNRDAETASGTRPSDGSFCHRIIGMPIERAYGAELVRAEYERL
jgi:hypothetical protein